MNEPRDVNNGKETMRAKAGDWIVRGPGDNYYACSDTQFKCTYEHLEESRYFDEGSEGHECGC